MQVTPCWRIGYVLRGLYAVERDFGDRKDDLGERDLWIPAGSIAREERLSVQAAMHGLLLSATSRRMFSKLCCLSGRLSASA